MSTSDGIRLKEYKMSSIVNWSTSGDFPPVSGAFMYGVKEGIVVVLKNKERIECSELLVAISSLRAACICTESISS